MILNENFDYIFFFFFWTSQAYKTEKTRRVQLDTVGVGGDASAAKLFQTFDLAVALTPFAPISKSNSSSAGLITVIIPYKSYNNNNNNNKSPLDIEISC